MNSKQSFKILNFRLNRHLIYQWDLLCCLVNRNIKVVYKRSFFGVFWMLIRPLLNLAVYAFVFRRIIPVDIPNFTSFLFIGLLFWSWFSNSLTQATGVIVQNKPLIKQPGFPTTVLPIVNVITEGIHLVFALPIVLVFFLYEGITLQLTVIYLPLVMILQFLLTLSLGYILASVNVIWRDTQHTIGILLQMLMYLSGIFYDVRTLPLEYQSFLKLNPMVDFLNTYRRILIDGTSPSWTPLALILIIICILLPLGLFLFERQSHHFVEEV